MNIRTLPVVMALSLATLALASTVWAQPLAPNQTQGFGNQRLLTFTYTESFDCVDEPNTDLNFNSILAQSDPAEFQIPICQVATEPSIDPAGGPIRKTAHLYVLVPMFSVNNDQNPADAISCTGVLPGTLCGTALGSTLISLFGAVPEAFKAHPLVTTQCPDRGSAPGTCTMHASRVDLAPLLAALNKIPSPATANIFLPTPNHDHVVDNDRVNTKAIWWEVRPILVLDQSDWPAADASSGITSSRIMDAAEAAGRAIEVGSHFFLFFSSRMDPSHMH
jgi:hypothetical protein